MIIQIIKSVLLHITELLSEAKVLGQNPLGFYLHLMGIDAEDKKKQEFVSKLEVEIGRHVLNIEDIIREYPDDDWGDYILEMIRIERDVR